MMLIGVHAAAGAAQSHTEKSTGFQQKPAFYSRNMLVLGMHTDLFRQGRVTLAPVAFPASADSGKPWFGPLFCLQLSMHTLGLH